MQTERPCDEPSHVLAIGVWGTPDGLTPPLGRYLRRLRTVCGGPYLPMVLAKDPATGTLAVPEGIRAALQASGGGCPLAATAAQAIDDAFGGLLGSDGPLEGSAAEEVVLLPVAASVAQAAVALVARCLRSDEVRSSGIFTRSFADGPNEPPLLVAAANEPAEALLQGLTVVVLLSRALAPAVAAAIDGTGTPPASAARALCPPPQVAVYFGFVASLLRVDASDPQPVDPAVRALLRLSPVPTAALPRAPDGLGEPLPPSSVAILPSDRLDGTVDAITEAFTRFLLEKVLVERLPSEPARDFEEDTGPTSPVAGPVDGCSSCSCTAAPVPPASDQTPRAAAADDPVTRCAPLPTADPRDSTPAADEADAATTDDINLVEIDFRWGITTEMAPSPASRKAPHWSHAVTPEDGFHRLVWDVVAGAAQLAAEVLVSDCTDPPRADGEKFGVVCSVAASSTDCFFVRGKAPPPEGWRAVARGGSAALEGSAVRARGSPGTVDAPAGSAAAFAWDPMPQLPPMGSVPLPPLPSKRPAVIALSFTNVWSVSEFTVRRSATPAAAASSAAAPPAVLHGIAIATRSSRRWYLCFAKAAEHELVLATISSAVTSGGAHSSPQGSPSPSGGLSSNFAAFASTATFAVVPSSSSTGGRETAPSSAGEQAAKRSPAALLAICATSGSAVGPAAGPSGLWQLYVAKHLQHSASLHQAGGATDTPPPTPRGTCPYRWSPYDPQREYARQKLPAQFYLDGTFNSTFEAVPTYPPVLVVPALATHATLRAAVQRRVNGRLEALTYFHARSGGCIVRCSQPTVVRDTLSRWTNTLAAGAVGVMAGGSGGTTPEGPPLLQLYRDTIASKAVETLDLRDKLAAFANVFKGGGYSAASEFCAMHNIHAVRKSYAQLCDLVQRNAAEAATKAPLCGSSLEAESVPGEAQALGPQSTVGDAAKAVLRTGWLDMVAVLLQTSLAVARKVAGVAPDSSSSGGSSGQPQGRRPAAGVPPGAARSFDASLALLRSPMEAAAAAVPSGGLPDLCDARHARVVVVHCSDGWDRTSQVCAVSQLLLDPYFRTIDGFCVLVEKDFVSFGHPFALRNDHCNGNNKQAAPIFFQFLDAVRHLVRLYPANFEFTEAFLLFVADCHVLGIAGNLVSNGCKEQRDAALPLTTVSLWQMVQLVLCDPTATAADHTEAEAAMPIIDASGSSSLPRIAWCPTRAADSRLVNVAYAHRWNLDSGCGGGELVASDIFPLTGHLWEGFFLRHSPFLAAPLDQQARAWAAGVPPVAAPVREMVADVSRQASLVPFSRSASLVLGRSTLTAAEADALAALQMSSLPPTATARWPAASGGGGPHTPVMLVPRNASFSSSSGTPVASPSRARRLQAAGPGGLFASGGALPSSEHELTWLEPAALLAPVPRNSSAASLMSMSPHVASSSSALAGGPLPLASRPPRPPSSILNQFLLADDDSD